MPGHQIAVERDSGIEHVLVEGREPLALRLHAVGEQRELLELQVLLLLEQKRQSQSHPERGRKTERLGAKVIGFERKRIPARRHDKIAEAARIRQQHGLTRGGAANAQLRDDIVRLPPNGGETIGALKTESRRLHGSIICVLARAL